MKSARELGSGIFLIGALVVGLLSPAGAEAAPGDLDTGFSADGRQRTDFFTGDSQAAAVVRQPDGKIVAVGVGAGDAFELARYNVDGSLDTTFSGDGRQTTEFVSSARANGVALQADGKIVVVGGSDSDFALARYNPPGSLDTSFSGDGKQTTDLGGGFNPDRATGVAIQADGKIVAVGVAGATSPGGASDDFGLARYNPSGSLDTSFSGDGKQRTQFTGVDAANGVAIQADGKIVAVGSSRSGTFAADFALARYNPSGSLDTSFSGDGKQRTDFGGTDQDVANGVAIQADGKIVAVGGTANGDFGLARYNANGALDTSFSGDGKQTTDFGGFEGAQGVAIQGDGKIVAAGFAGASSTVDDFALARYNTDGSLDTTFSGDGIATTDFFGNRDRAGGLALQGDGKIVAVGDTSDSLGATDFALARYNTDGSLDTTFSGDGRQTTSFAGFEFANGVAIQGDGKIVTVGYTQVAPGQGAFALARYNANGSPDLSFSDDGRQVTAFAGGAWGVAIQANGKIVVVGDGGIARYNPDGSLDTAFSGDGKQTTDFFAMSVALQANGRIVVAGTDLTAGDFAIARYNPNGSLDTSFSGDGRQTTDFGGNDEANGVRIQADGKIVAAGATGAGNGGFALARYNPNGSLDTSFSGDGRQTTNFGGGAFAVAIQTNGKIVAAGGTDGGRGDFALARYNPNGLLDTTFSGDGKQTTNFLGFDDSARGVAIQGDGKIVVAGSADTGGISSDFGLARYNANGALDTSFSGDGRQRTNFGGDDDALGIALQADGKIVAVGGGFGTDRTLDFAVARYLGG